jgi:hypothetical protein
METAGALAPKTRAKQCLRFGTGRHKAREGAGFTAFTGEDRNTGTGWLRSQSRANPSPKSFEFPANREINREKHRNPAICGREGLQTPFQDKDLQPFSLLNPNREFFSTNREISSTNREIPGHNRDTDLNRGSQPMRATPVGGNRVDLEDRRHGLRNGMAGATECVWGRCSEQRGGRPT